MRAAKILLNGEEKLWQDNLSAELFQIIVQGEDVMFGKLGFHRATMLTLLCVASQFNLALTQPAASHNFAGQLNGHSLYGDFDLTVQVRSTENFNNNGGADFCFVYGFQDEYHYYYVMFNRNLNDTRVYKIKDTDRIEIGDLGTFVIPDNGFHEVRLRRSGGQIEVFFDNTLLGTGNDAEYGSGGVGLGSFNDMANFDDFCIKALNTSTCLYSDNFESGSGNWLPLNPSRWSVVNDAGDFAYGINTSDYSNLSPLRLGEYSLLAPVGGFTETGITLEPVGFSGAAAWGDYDNDGDLDIALAGTAGAFGGTAVFKIYENRAGSFVDLALNLPGFYATSLEWGDYDNDNDLDLLLTGNSFDTKIFRNDAVVGGRIFVEASAGLLNVRDSFANWADYDNDGDLDVLLAGNDGQDAVAKIYRNDGGYFVDVLAPLTGVSQGPAAAWGDYDEDGDLDLALAGIAAGSQGPSAKIYRNESGASFADLGAGLTGVSSAALAWGDYDNDGDLDLLCTGFAIGQAVTKIYRNDTGVFVDNGTGLPGISGVEAAWGDYDNDGNLDILAGHIIYRNTAGGFSDIAAPFIASIEGSSAWGDYDNDGDLDVLTVGYSQSVGRIAKVYRNEVNAPNTPPGAPGNLSVAILGDVAALSWAATIDNNTPQAALTYNLRVGTTTPGGSEILSPMAGAATGARQIVALGNASLNTRWTLAHLPNGIYYWSAQALDHAFAASTFAPEQSFVIANAVSAPRNLRAAADASEISLTWDAGATGNLLRYRVYRGVSPNAFALFDSVNASAMIYQDGNAAGGTTYFYRLAAVDQSLRASPFSNTASAQLTNVLFTDLSAPVNRGAGGVWSDFDNDGDLDVLAAGNLYRNDNSGLRFINLGAAPSGAIAWGDFDNDNDLDLLATTKIYRNEGGALVDLGLVLTPSYAWGDYDHDGDLDVLGVSNIYRNTRGSFIALAISLPHASAWGDYDGDGDLDALARVPAGPRLDSLKIYRNDAGVFFTLHVAATNYHSGTLLWVDYDGDGDLDIYGTGQREDSSGDHFSTRSELYRNDNGAFPLAITFSGAVRGGAAWGDYDNDGDLDLLLNGKVDDFDLQGHTQLFRNDNGAFNAIATTLLPAFDSSVAWGDYDNDGDLDILLVGPIASKIYRNNAVASNTAPMPPTALTATVNDSAVTFAWMKASDAQTPQTALRYNLRVGTTPDGAEIVSPMADAQNGYLRLPLHGNAGYATSWTIAPFLPGKYYWSVQTIDNSFAGSAFAPEQSFTISSCVSNGDVNDDGRLTPGDALCAFQIYLNAGSLPADCDAANAECELIAADVSCDGSTTPGDALAIFSRFLQGLPPAECFAKAALVKANDRAAYRLSLHTRSILPPANSAEPELVRVALRVDNPAGLSAFGLTLGYPVERLEYLGVQRAALTKEWVQLEGVKHGNGEIIIGGFHTAALQSVAAGEIVEVLFTSKNGMPGLDGFTVTRLRDDFQSANVALGPGAEGSASIPQAFKLYPSFPNPYRLSQHHSEILLRFDLPGNEAVKVELVIYNLMGQAVRRLISAERAPGAYEAKWDGRDERGRLVPSGTFLYRLRAGTHVSNRRLTVVR